MTASVLTEHPRQGGGEKRRRLVPSEVTEIRRRYRDEPGLTYRSLGEEYGMSPLTMHLLITGKTWKDVPGAVTEEARRGPRRGPRHPHARLSRGQVMEMLVAYNADQSLTYDSLAKLFGVSRQVVTNTFKNLEEWVGEGEHVPEKRSRGRRRGERHPFARLSDAEVATMRDYRAIDRRHWTLSRLGERFGVCPSMVSRVVRGKSRKDAGGPIEGGQS